MELRHLRYFVAVAEEEHVGRAARRLHVSASPLSRQIQQLANEIGVELFVREGRRIRLTDAGKALLEQARDLLTGIDRAVAIVQAASRGEVGRLRIGFVESARFAQLIPHVVRRFRCGHPNVAIDLLPMRSHEQWMALDAGRIDAALNYNVGNEPSGFKVEPLWVERVMVVVPREHPLVRRRRIFARDLAGEPMIWTSRDHAPYYSDLVRAALQERGIEPNVVVETPSNATRMSLVASGAGIAFTVPASTTGFHDIVARPVADIRIEVTSVIAWRGRDAASRMLRSLVRDVLACVKTAND
ncbi:MAG: LysR family regulatory protein CidR [bacterium]|nr:LysR family regulatory protein CidR [bacterium]